jgi:hypothetical protein
MKRRLTSIATSVALLLAGAAGGFHLRAQAPAAAPPDTAALRAQYDRWRQDFKTWGKWGPDDNKGASNLITPQKVMSAVRLVKSGTVVSLAPPVPQVAAADVNAGGVFHRTVNAITTGVATDTYQVSYHGQTVAHMDTWCHFFENGQMYNGLPVKDNVTLEAGCKKGGIMNWRDGVFTRAVLYDIAQLKGVDWVEPGTPIRRADLEAWEKKSGVKAAAGDVVLLYIGPLEAAGGDGAVDGAGGRLLRRHDSLDARADAGIHRPRLQHRVESEARLGRRAQPGAHRRAQLDGHQHRGVPGPGAGGRDGAQAESLRVPDLVRAAARGRRHGVAAEPAGDFLEKGRPRGAAPTEIRARRRGGPLCPP